MFDQMLSSLITLSLLVFLFLWALLIDFLIHLQKRSSAPLRSSGVERRKCRLVEADSEVAPLQARLTNESTFRDV